MRLQGRYRFTEIGIVAASIREQPLKCEYCSSRHHLTKRCVNQGTSLSTPYHYCHHYQIRCK